jgi:Flp pilus assembly protein TadG
MTHKSMIGWVKGERGNVALLFALMLPMVIGGAAFGVETTYWYLTRLQMQSAADAAAFAGAMEKRSGGSNANVLIVATKAATDNGFSNATGTITVNTPPLSGTSGTKAVEVIINSTAERFFTAVFTKTAVDIKARAVAKYTTAGTACVLALSYTASKAAEFSGNGTTTLTSCSVMSNSTSPTAIYNGGSSVLSTECLISVGGIGGGGTVNQECDGAILKAPPVGDPFAGKIVPTATGTTFNKSNYNAQNESLTPGIYPNGIDIKNNATFAPGNYFITGGSFSAGAQAVITQSSVTTGDGVTFYLGPNVSINFNGGATVNLTAPANPTSPTGLLNTGMLFVGDPTTTAKQIINGNASSHLTGDIYFKKAEVDFLGNFSGLNGCMHIVADTVLWSGNSTVNADCSGYGMIEIPGIFTVKLSE